MARTYRKLESVPVADLSVADLTVSQAARRQRVIDAALVLGSAGGYEAVQMRDVARTAGVALGTIYRYFTSKDHLLAAAMVDWAADLERRIAQRPHHNGSTADSVVDVIRRATRPMERDPRLASAMVQAASANEPSVAVCQQQTTDTIERVLTAAMDGTDPDRRARTARVLAHVWNSSVLRWANGSEAVGQIGNDLEDAARLLLD
jgi:AcrR family transcriptional regulator